MLKYIRKAVWVMIVAYLLGLYNMYHQEDKTPEDMLIATKKEAG